MRSSRTPLAALAAVAALTLSACGGSDSDGEAASESTPSSAASSASTDDTMPSTDVSTSSAPAGPTKIAVNGGFTDDVLGDSAKITALVRDFPATSNTTIAEGGGEWVLVEIDAKAGTKYTGGFRGPFALLDASGNVVGSPTTVIDADVKAAGYTPFVEADSGKESKGWIVFQVNNRQDSYTFRYKRQAASVIGGGDPIPEKIYTVELPTS